MLRITSGRTLEIDAEVCICFIDWQKAFDRVNWIKLMQILKGTGINRHGRRLIRNLYMAQSVKVRLNQRKTSSVKTGRRIRQGYCLSPVWFNLYSESLTKEALEGFGDLKTTGGQIINTMKCADDLVLLAKKEMVLQDMIDKLIQTGRHCGM
jgi:hypothetical protein